MDPYLGEIRCFSFGRVPVGWLPCNGQILQRSAYQALGALLGAVYGGDGTTTFGLPDLRGRTMMHYGAGIAVGTSAGQESVALDATSMPAHTHDMAVATVASTVPGSPTGLYLAPVTQPHLPYGPYQGSANVAALASDVVGNAGGGAAHNNMQPFLVLNYCIATSGNWPPHP